MRPFFHRCVYNIYNTLVFLFFPIVLIAVLLRWRKRVAKGLQHWSERRGYLSDAQNSLFAMGHRWWWIHAVSLGEVKAIERFLRTAPSHAGVKVLLSVVTPEALAYAQEAHLVDQVIAAPVDLPWMVRRVFHVVRPEWFLSVESEFWPNLLREASRSGAHVGIINGRISQRSFRRYRWIRWLLGALWENLHFIAVREEQDAQRFEMLGLSRERIHVVGHMKYDVPVEASPLMLSSAPLLVFGSTREGEELLLLPIMTALRSSFPHLRIICAPRHKERTADVESRFMAANLPVRKRSATLTQPITAGELVLWDTFGDLMEAYRQSDIAVIGGSFVHKGGQNPIEPASLGKPVVFGLSMENFKDIAETLLAGQGAMQVPLEKLEETLRDLLNDLTRRRTMGDNARAVVEKARGATERTLDLLEHPL